MICDLVNQEGETLRTLGTSKYFSIDFINDEYGHFAIFHLNDIKGFYTINSKEEILFQVYNRTIGEPNPDYLVENKIRVVGDNDRIGFADQKGKIVIEPQFEMVSEFHENKAIIGEGCRKKDWHTSEEETGCNHY
jgi:hypothetical protein